MLLVLLLLLLLLLFFLKFKALVKAEEDSLMNKIYVESFPFIILHGIPIRKVVFPETKLLKTKDKYKDKFYAF